MPYYRFDNGLQPLSAPPEDWQGVLAVLEPSELHSAPLPSWLTRRRRLPIPTNPSSAGCGSTGTA